MRKSKYRIYLILTIVVMIFIFIQSSLSGDLSSAESNILVAFFSGFIDADPQTISFVIRKCAHFTEYLILGALITLTWMEHHKEREHAEYRPFVGGLFAWAIGTMYAGTDEIHQLFVSERSGELRDVIIDSCGVLAGVLIAHVIVSVRSRSV